MLCTSVNFRKHSKTLVKFIFQIPELAGFLLLTILPQAPLILVLLFFDSLIIMPLEYAVHSILVVMIVFQVVFALPTVKNIARRSVCYKYFLPILCKVYSIFFITKLKKFVLTELSIIKHRIIFYTIIFKISFNSKKL